MALIIDNKVIENQMNVLSAAASMDSDLGQRLRESIYQELKAARNRIVGDIRFKNGDPRETARSVKRYVAGKYLGGVVSITDGKPTGRRNSYEAPRKVWPGMKGKRGGNRMLRSQRTDDILHTADRAFILRWLNKGTNPRYSGGGRVALGRYSSAKNFFKMQEEGEGWRGSITPRNFFELVGKPELQTAIINLQKIINQEFDKLFS